MQRSILAAAAIAAAVAFTPANAGVSSSTTTCSGKETRSIIRKFYSSPKTLTAAKRRKVRRLVRCSDQQDYLRKWKRWRYQHRWDLRWQREPLWLRQKLGRIAACESGGDSRAIGGGGAYRGKYQFDYGTWRSVGGSGDPAAAPEREQDVRAARLYRSRGSQPWPVCG